MSSAAPATAAETIEELLQFGLRCAHDAGRVLLKTWSIHPNDRAAFSTKSSSADVVTETDQECERIIVAAIKQRYPSHLFIGEESHESEGSYEVNTDPAVVTWIVDPIDGTNNFVHQLPNVAVSVGVVIGTTVSIGIVHCPVQGDTYFATRGGGAWKVKVNSSTGAFERSEAVRLQVSKIDTLQRACVATEMGYSRTVPPVELMQAKTAVLLREGLQSLRMSGSCCCNMAAVAAGGLDCYYEGVSTSSGPKPWDVCAGSLLVTEAGGVVQDVSGREFSMYNGRVLVANNAKIAEKVAAAVNQATEEWGKKYPDLVESVSFQPGAGIAKSPTASKSKL